MNLHLPHYVIFESSDDFGQTTARMRRFTGVFSGGKCDNYQNLISRLLWALSPENMIFLHMKNKGTDQLAHQRSLISALVIGPLKV